MYNVIDYLENSARLHRSKIAVIEEDKKISYSELNKRSKIVGSYLIDKEVFNEPIIIFMDKGIDTLISFFGTIYSGCFYTLINPELPESRIEQIKTTLNSKYVITDDSNISDAKKLFKNIQILNILVKLSIKSITDL